MKHFIRVLLVLCSSFYISNAYEVPEILSPEFSFKEYKAGIEHNLELSKYEQILASDVAKRPYDVQSYKLNLDWTKCLNSANAQHEFTGVCEIKLKIDSANVKQIVLNSVALSIQKVYLNDVFLSDNFVAVTDSELIITMAPIPKLGDILKIRIEYLYNFANNRGFYSYPKGLSYLSPYNDSMTVEENLAYTMSEPQDARYWFPCNDAPIDKASSSISIKVPTGFTAVSNGLLDSTIVSGDNTTFYWSDDTPISTYLMQATASKFVEYKEYYHKITADADSVPIMYYCWEKDLDGTQNKQFNAINAYKPTIYMMNLYSAKFTEYPFKKYGMVPVDPFAFGGMEHQTITTIARNWLRGKSGIGIAHELAHQWLGDLITCSSWKDIWINEGGATWSEAVYIRGGDTSKKDYYPYMDYIAEQYFKKAKLYNTPIYNLPIPTFFGDNYPLAYHKASWIYHQLSEILGDDLFFKGLRNLLTSRAYTGVSNEEYRKAFEEVAPNPVIPYDVFFDQWLKKAGHPIYKLQGEYYADSKSTTYSVNVEQVQSGENIPDCFQAPLELQFFKAGSLIKAINVVNTTKMQKFTINYSELGVMPDSIAVNASKVLCKHYYVGFIASVESDKQINSGIYPNPALSGAIVNAKIASLESNNVDCAIYDNLGNFIRTVYLGSAPTGELDFSFSNEGLATGAYMLICKSNEFTKTLRFSVIK